MIDFTTVTREFRSLVHRRRMLMTFLGSVFAATGVFLHNVLRGNLPRDLQPIQRYIFAFYALMASAYPVALTVSVRPPRALGSTTGAGGAEGTEGEVTAVSASLFATDTRACASSCEI